MSEIRYLVGDATRPERRNDEAVVIAHVVNDEGAWGRGFVTALSRWDDGPERAYRRWHRVGRLVDAPFRLGQLQLVPFGPRDDDLWVVNLVAQRGWRRGDGDPQTLDPQALRACLRDLADLVLGPFDRAGARVVMPRIGCGLGGARWADVAPIVRAELVDRGIDVTVYSLPGESWDDDDDGRDLAAGGEGDDPPRRTCEWRETHTPHRWTDAMGREWTCCMVALN